MTVVAAALIDGERRILLQRRAAGKAMGGLWEFPGGKVEPGEHPEAALVRELREELGIETLAEDLVPACFATEAAGDRPMILLLYQCRRWSGVPEPLDASALKWLVPEAMDPAEMPPADRPLIAMLSAMIGD